MRVYAVATPSLGDTSYVLVHEGHAIVVDPQRDLGRFLDVLEAEDAAVSHVLDTHVHNDYLSGAKALAERMGAELVLPAASAAAFAFVPAFHFEEIEGEGGLAIRPLHTPGHTPEHTSYLVLIEGEPRAVFSGGSLLLGSAGRTDLLGDDLAAPLARLQHGSVHRLAALPDQVMLYPTHGTGSFCTSSAAGSVAGAETTIGAERATNPVLAHPDVDRFVEAQLSGLVPYPVYYGEMAPLNRRGPAAAEIRPPRRLGKEEVAEALEQGAWVVDARPRSEYAAGHLPGSLNIEPGDGFAPWVGWLVPFGAPVILVAADRDAATGLAVELSRIGYEVAGQVEPAALPGTRSIETADLDRLAAALGEETVLDVRDPSEWESGHLRGSTHRYVPSLLDGEALDGRVWLVCASGFRSSIAAGLVERLGWEPVVVTSGGVPDLLRARPKLRA